MKNHRQDTERSETAAARHGCNHPHAVMVNPSKSELRELEAMLARCPNCSRWSPGDGPIMAVLAADTSSWNDDSKDFR